MNKLLGLLIGLMILTGVSQAYTTHTTKDASTASATTTYEVTFSNTVNSVALFNDATSESIYVNFEGNLTSQYKMTSEAFELKAGEYVIKNDFITKKVKLLAKSGSPAFRIFGDY